MSVGPTIAAIVKLVQAADPQIVRAVLQLVRVVMQSEDPLRAAQRAGIAAVAGEASEVAIRKALKK
jgi:hypothetical protein